MPKFIDLTGQKYGRLTILNRAPNSRQGVMWNCLCDCGNQTQVSTRALRSGNTKSCGCLHRELVGKQFSKDLTNQRFGNLIALEPTADRKHGSVVWKCQCDCGNIHYTTAELLLNGHTSSCGCLHSKGNQKIQQILQQNNIPFVKEYPIRINNINYYYDFAICKDTTIICFIEYDGVLHFPQDSFHGWNNKENWERTQHNDIIKNQYAQQQQIPLIRIPYWDYNNLNITYLKNEMEKYKCTVDILLN